jgi:hypothetical protein
VAQELAMLTGATWRTVGIIADDGVYLEGWMFVPQSFNGEAVIVAHEMGGSRLSLLHFVKWLLRAGYMCLVPDGRAHGMSGDSVMTHGIRERHDIVSWQGESEQNIRRPATPLGSARHLAEPSCCKAQQPARI